MEIWTYARETLGYVFIGLGLLFMIIGTVGIFKFRDKKSFYIRILVASKVDTVGMLTAIIGFSLLHGLSFFTGKLILIAIIIIVLNPLVAHIVTRSVYDSGYEVSDKSSQAETPAPPGDEHEVDDAPE